jgi:hypothetical protein
LRRSSKGFRLSGFWSGWPIRERSAEFHLPLAGSQVTGSAELAARQKKIAIYLDSEVPKE